MITIIFIQVLHEKRYYHYETLPLVLQSVYITFIVIVIIANLPIITTIISLLHHYCLLYMPIITIIIIM